MTIFSSKFFRKRYIF